MPHTPGPWTALEVNRKVFDVIAGGSDRAYICRTTIGTPSEANAHLIAAAPDLLAASQAEQEWRDREEAGALDPEWDYETMVGSKRRAAITKAEGR